MSPCLSQQSITSLVNWIASTSLPACRQMRGLSRFGKEAKAELGTLASADLDLPSRPGMEHMVQVSTFALAVWDEAVQTSNEGTEYSVYLAWTTWFRLCPSGQAGTRHGSGRSQGKTPKLGRRLPKHLSQAAACADRQSSAASCLKQGSMTPDQVNAVPADECSVRHGAGQAPVSQAAEEQQAPQPWRQGDSHCVR